MPAQVKRQRDGRSQLCRHDAFFPFGDPAVRHSRRSEDIMSGSIISPEAFAKLKAKAEKENRGGPAVDSVEIDFSFESMETTKGFLQDIVSSYLQAQVTRDQARTLIEAAKLAADINFKQAGNKDNDAVNDVLRKLASLAAQPGDRKTHDSNDDVVREFEELAEGAPEDNVRAGLTHEDSES